MKIAFISARHSSESACEHYIHKALINMGHEVIADLDFRLNPDTINDNIPQKADMLLAWKGSSLDPDIIKNLDYPTVLWYPDFWEMDHTKKDILNIGLSFDYLYTPIMRDVDVYKEMGCNTFYLAPSVDCDTFKRLGTPKTVDIAFVGALYENRVIQLIKLSNSVTKKIIIGNRCSHKEMNHIYNEAKIILNEGIIPGHGAQLRCFEAMASGSLLLNIGCQELQDIFEHGKHLAFYQDNTILDVASYLLQHDEEREKIAECGMREVQKNHTWEKRLQVIIDNLK